MTDFNVEWRINFDKRDKNGIPQITRTPGCPIDVEHTDTVTFSLTIIQYGLKMNVPVGKFAGCRTELANSIESQLRHDTYTDVDVTDVETGVKRHMKYIPEVNV